MESHDLHSQSSLLRAQNRFCFGCNGTVPLPSELSPTFLDPFTRNPRDSTQLLSLPGWLTSGARSHISNETGETNKAAILVTCQISANEIPFIVCRNDPSDLPDVWCWTQVRFSTLCRNRTSNAGCLTSRNMWPTMLCGAEHLTAAEVQRSPSDQSGTL